MNASSMDIRKRLLEACGPGKGTTACLSRRISSDFIPPVLTPPPVEPLLAEAQPQADLRDRKCGVRHRLGLMQSGDDRLRTMELRLH